MRDSLNVHDVQKVVVREVGRLLAQREFLLTTAGDYVAPSAQEIQLIQRTIDDAFKRFSELYCVTAIARSQEDAAAAAVREELLRSAV
jgi:hypothetical protein